MKMLIFGLVVIVADILHAAQALNVSAVHPRPHEVVLDVHRRMNESITRRQLMGQQQSCRTGNPVDDCWRCDPNWESNRQRLAECAVGFGADAQGGKNGRIYTVTDSSDDPVNPAPGTLRFGAIQTEPLWIIFARNMMIYLKEELMINSYKTIDGRGVKVHISHGPCLTIQGVDHVIIHGLLIHDCHSVGSAMVRDSPTHFGWRTRTDGDGISIFQASHIWVDHCTLARCADGLIDAVQGSTALSFTNNHFSRHNEVMLLGASDSYMPDKNMQVTIAFNHFAEGLTQRMPRCRLGYFHIVNNDYTRWGMGAIGGSGNPTIISMGNRFTAPDNIYAKQITYRVFASASTWKSWSWRSIGDQYLNGAYFVESGTAQNNILAFSQRSIKTVNFVPILTVNAGFIPCRTGGRC